MSYTVPGMVLIPQDKTMACWYAGCQMLIEWKRGRYGQCLPGHPDPSNDTDLVRKYKANGGIYDSFVLTLARKLGLWSIPGGATPTVVYLERMLRMYGPLFINGNRHHVVFAGIRNTDVLIYDPAPVNKGSIKWRSLSEFFPTTPGRGHDAAYYNTKTALFLYHP